MDFTYNENQKMITEMIQQFGNQNLRKNPILKKIRNFSDSVDFPMKRLSKQLFWGQKVSKNTVFRFF